MLKTTIAVMSLIASSSVARAQTPPTQAEVDQWNKDPGAGVLESSPCKKITWLLDGEGKLRADLHHQPIRYALGWWGRGFIEGAVYMIDGKKGGEAQKKASDFGLSVEVVAAHIATYCHDHEDKTPGDAIQNLLVKVLK